MNTEQMTPENTLELIKKRRSIYPVTFDGTKVSEEAIDMLLEAANWAPTHGMTEPWRFTVFSGDGLKALATFQSELYKKNVAADVFDEKVFTKLQQNPLMCSHVISIGMKRQEIEKIPENEEIASVACAVQNMHLMATSLGIGAYWGSGGITYMENAKPYFGLGEKDKLLGFFFIGNPKGFWPISKRKPIDLKVTRKYDE